MLNKKSRYRIGEREYGREWYHKNRERIRAKYNERYHNDSAFRERVLNWQLEYAKKHRDRINMLARLRHHSDENYRLHRNQSHSETYLQRRNETKRFVFAQLGNKCVTCGETEFACLDCHHTDGHTSMKALGITDNLEKWRKNKDQISQLILLCSNCHRKLHFGVLKLG